MSGFWGWELFENFMQAKILSRQTLLVTILAGFAFTLALSLYFIQQSFNLSAASQFQSGPAWSSEGAIVFPKQEQASFGLPMRLKIPGISVDSAIEYVGLTSDGAMDAPKSPDEVAWYNLGPRPGENGSAVLAGHFGWKNGKAAVFDDLDKLRQGDKLYVVDDTGEIISFVVRESRSYDPRADASDVFILNDGKAHLNLITCEGVWDKVLKSYSKRLVVFTDKE